MERNIESRRKKSGGDSNEGNTIVKEASEEDKGRVDLAMKMRVKCSFGEDGIK